MLLQWIFPPPLNALFLHPAGVGLEEYPTNGQVPTRIAAQPLPVAPHQTAIPSGDILIGLLWDNRTLIAAVVNTEVATGMIHDPPAITGNPTASSASAPPAPRLVPTAPPAPASYPLTTAPPPNPAKALEATLLGKLTATTPVFQAQVVEQSASGLLRLRVGELILKAQAPDIRLQPGDSLRLQLLSLDKVPQLKILSLPNTSPPEHRLLLQLLPKEGDFQQLFRQFNGLQLGQPLTATPAAAPAQGTTPPIPLMNQPLPQLVELLSNQVLTSERISPRVIESLFLASGLFLEARLARADRAEPQDLKAALLRLVALLQPGGSEALPDSPFVALFQRLFKGVREKNDNLVALSLELQDKALKQLRQAAEGALAKLEIRQLNSLPQQDEARVLWQFALPLRDEDQVRDLEIQIEREKAREANQDGDRWTVNLHFDFASTGPLDVRVNLKQETVDVALWALRQETLEQVTHQLPQLHRRLEQVGLEVRQLNLYRGTAPRPALHPALAENGLLHELA
jgi:hypothetical protein